MDHYEGEFKKIMEKMTEYKDPIEKLREKMALVNSLIKTRSQSLNAEFADLVGRSDQGNADRSYIQQRMVGKVLLKQFIYSPLSAENQQLIKGCIFDYSKTLGLEQRQSLVDLDH